MIRGLSQHEQQKPSGCCLGLLLGYESKTMLRITGQPAVFESFVLPTARPRSKKM